jgi:hypothetical protein
MQEKRPWISARLIDRHPGRDRRIARLLRPEVDLRRHRRHAVLGERDSNDRVRSRIAAADGAGLVRLRGARGFGITVMLGLPGGVEVMLYEPRHATPIETTAR